jgi:hypothetical protein
MKDLLSTADEIAKEMKEKGYEYFNIKHGAARSAFGTGIASYLQYASFNSSEPLFPIYVGSGVAATSPDNPYTWATFKIVEDAQKGIRIDTMDLSMYGCYGGALRMHLELKIKSLDDVPSRQNAAMLIKEKWEKRHQVNQIIKKTVTVKSEMPKPQKSRGRKM